MSQAEIVQYENELPHEKAADEMPPRTGKTIVLWRFFERENITPTHNPETQYPVLVGHELVGEKWQAQYNIVDFTHEEIAKRTQDNYLASLNWGAFESQLINISEGTPYRQLSEWAATDPKFADCKTNLAFALTRQNEVFLQQALADIKQKTAVLPQFTAGQLVAINNCLQTLGVNWTWDSL